MLQRGLLIVAAVMALLVGGALALNAQTWIDRTFPGFFLLGNRVIPSIGLSWWSGTREGSVYQRTLVAVDGTEVSSSAGAYARIAAQPPGRMFTYTLRHGTSTESLTLPSQVFARFDYWAIFGAYLATGILYILLGLAGAWQLPATPIGRALLAVGGTGGIFALSAIDLYGPGFAIRIHAIAEACFPAALLTFAVVFPHDLGKWSGAVLGFAWLLSSAIAAFYQLVVDQPGAYSVVHGAAETYMGFAGLALIARLVIAYTTAGDDAPVLLRAALAGAAMGLGLPAVVMALSGVSGGAVPVNLCTITAFLFPLCLGIGLVAERSAAWRAVSSSARHSP